MTGYCGKCGNQICICDDTYGGVGATPTASGQVGNAPASLIEKLEASKNTETPYLDAHRIANVVIDNCIAIIREHFALPDMVERVAPEPESWVTRYIRRIFHQS